MDNNLNKNIVLINVPDLDLTGGVANHYKGLKPFFSSRVKYNKVGRRLDSKLNLAFYFFDYVTFFLKILRPRVKIIVLNPSLSFRAIVRDSIYLWISKLFNKQIITFIHGWNKDVEKHITLKPFIFKMGFNFSNHIIVLSNEFKSKILKWNYKANVSVLTTKVDDQLLKYFSIQNKDFSKKSVLFLARIEKNKGVYEAIEAVRETIDSGFQTNIVISGTGSELTKVKEYVNTKGYHFVEFTGQISGSRLIKTFSESCYYILPTTHGEGMPTSLIEAMAFGNIIISRPVGGIKDFFEEKKMGAITKQTNSQAFAKILIDFFNKSLEQKKKIGAFNHSFAKKNFLASNVAQKMEEIFNKL